MADNKTSILLTADDKTKAAFDSAKRGLSGLEGAAVRINGVLAGLGAGLTVGGVAAFVKSSIDAADNLNDLAKKTGVVVEQLAGFDLAAKSSGTNLEDVGTALGKLNKYMGQAAAGNKDAAGMLKSLGVSAKTPEEALYQLADAFGRMGSEGDKARAFSEVLGKSWQNLAPLLSEGGAGLRTLVEEGRRLNPVTKEMAEQADKFNDALAKIKLQAAGVGTSIAADILPSLNKMLEQMNAGIQIFGSFGSALYNIGWGINPINSIPENLAKYRKEIADLEKFKASASNPDESFVRDVDARIEAARKKLEFVKYMQRQEALALNDKYGTGNYKMPGEAAKPPIKLPKLGGDGKKPKDRMSEVEWAMEESAHLTRTYHQLGREMDEATEAAFERATEAAEAWQHGLDAANARLGEAARGYLDLIDPIEKYRRQLQEIRDLVEAGLLNTEQATAAEFAIQQQIDAAAGFGEQLKENKSIAEELGMTFSSAFEDAVVGGKKFQDILRGVYQDLLRLTVRKTVTEPLAEGFSGLLKGVNWSSFLPKFAAGTDYVPRDMLAVVHKGEAIIPAAENRQGAGGGITVNMTVVAQDAGSFRKSMGQIQTDMAFAVSGARRFA